ncbi:Ig-like domain-containing protein, partial [Escherichia coli O79:H4]
MFDLTVDFSSDNNWTWVRNCLSQLMGGPSSVSDSHDSTDPSVFQVGKTHPETGATLPDRKYALVCISNGKADVTFSGTHTYNGTYNFSRKYSLKAGNIIDEVGPLYNPGNGIGIVGGKLQMQEPSITPSNVSGIRKTWESNNTGIATVDATTGLVTFKAPGDVTITFIVTDDAGRKTSSTSFTVKQMTPQWRMWIGRATNGAYPNPAGTSGMKTFSASRPMEYGSGPKVGQIVYFGAYIPEIIGLPRNQIQLLFGS